MAEVKTIAPQKRSRFSWGLSDSLVLIKRSMMHIIKSPDQLMSVAFQPIMFTLLFRYVFGGSIDTGNISYINFLMAGILVQTAAFGSSYTALGVATDLQRGIIDRFKSLPMMSSSVLVGHTVADLVRNSISSIVMIGVGYLVGFRPQASVTDWLLVAGIMLLFSFALSWLSSIMGLLAKSVEAVQWMTFIFIMPLTFASSAFVPAENMHSAIRGFAINQPVTHVIEAVRALLVGKPVEDHAWLAIVWCSVILVLSIPLAAYIFRRKASR